MAEEVETVDMGVAVDRPLARSAGDQQPAVADEGMVGAEHVQIRGLGLAGHDRVGRDIVDARLLPRIVAYAFLLIHPMFVAAEQDDFALRAGRHQCRVHRKDFTVGLRRIPRHGSFPQPRP